MFRKFIEGLALGAGFAVSFLAVSWLGLVAFLPMTFGTRPGTAPTANTSFLSFSDALEEATFTNCPSSSKLKRPALSHLCVTSPHPTGK